MFKIDDREGGGTIKDWFKKTKKIISYLFKDSNFLLGLGVGIMISTLILSSFSYSQIPKYKIEMMARKMGMIYPDEIKAYFEGDKK
ncbi:hypothetical protein FDN13_00710 [Caloramator sp. E03]|uniref:hypothetical protein n=1 Tax=Caloramator sp. E03 TaxID=2576307 RepID=UPI001110E539|nr:hypothetical protein [Caloramator sp. E03]QCX32331.1 hypothetical protein FDN13_00710 [Caloramator sp. E03]